MTGTINFLLFFSLLLAAVQANTLNANDAQSCTDLCASCEGSATFENGICKCFVAENDGKGRECLMRLKRETEDLDLDTSSDNPEDAERSARCSLLGSRRHFGSADADIVASYFMNGGPMTGSPLVGSTNSGPCGVSSSSDPLTGAVNPSNAKPLPAQPAVEKPVNPPIAKNPVITQPSHTCPSSQYESMVSNSWMPSHDAGYGPTIGSPHSYRPFYPQILSAIPHMVMEIPNAIVRAASQIPSHTSGLLSASQHSPILASLASGTSGLQRLSKMLTPYVSEENRIVGAAQQQTSQCPFSSKMVGAPAPAEGQSEPMQINASMLQQVLAQQNSLLEALSQQLEGLSPQVLGAPRVQYGSMPPGRYVVGAPQAQPMAQYAPQPMAAQYASQPLAQFTPAAMGQYAAQQPIGQYAAQYLPQPKVQYCVDASPTVGAGAPELPKKPPLTWPKENDIVSAANPSSSTGKVERNVTEKAPQAVKTLEESKKSQEQEIPKIQREPRMRSSNRRKRGDVKYAKKKDSEALQIKSSSSTVKP